MHRFLVSFEKNGKVGSPALHPHQSAFGYSTVDGAAFRPGNSLQISAVLISCYGTNQLRSFMLPAQPPRALCWSPLSHRYICWAKRPKSQVMDLKSKNIPSH